MNSFRCGYRPLDLWRAAGRCFQFHRNFLTVDLAALFQVILRFWFSNSTPAVPDQPVQYIHTTSAPTSIASSIEFTSSVSLVSDGVPLYSLLAASESSVGSDDVNDSISEVSVGAEVIHPLDMITSNVVGTLLEAVASTARVDSTCSSAATSLDISISKDQISFITEKEHTKVKFSTTEISSKTLPSPVDQVSTVLIADAIDVVVPACSGNTHWSSNLELDTLWLDDSEDPKLSEEESLRNLWEVISPL